MDIQGWQIDKSSPLPYYYQLERILQQDIDKGFLHTDDVLPSEGEIASRIDVSIGVVRQAFKRLEQAGIIIRQKGKKARIAAEPKIKLTYMANLISLDSELKAKRLEVNTKVLKQSVVAPPQEVCEAMEIGRDHKVVQLSRLRSVAGKPMIFWISYVSSALCPNLEKLDLTNRSLYSTLHDQFGLKPDSTEDTLEVVPADSYLSDLLQVSVGDPLVYIVSITRLSDNTVMEYYEAWHKAGGWKFTFKSKH